MREMEKKVEGEGNRGEGEGIGMQTGGILHVPLGKKPSGQARTLPANRYYNYCPE